MFQELTGRTFGPSDPQTVSQAQVDAFAAATGDDQWLHVDVGRAQKESPYRQTVAHGMLTLSLAPALVMAMLPLGDALVINYGLDRVRFPAPLLVGSQVRLEAEVAEVKSVSSGVQLTVDVRLQSDAQENPSAWRGTCSSSWPERRGLSKQLQPRSAPRHANT